MSKPISLNITPVSRPSAFTVVAHADVRSGDVYQGSRKADKWYANTEGQKCVDEWRTYYRPVAGAGVTVSDRSVRRMSHVTAPLGSRKAGPVTASAAAGGAAPGSGGASSPSGATEAIQSVSSDTEEDEEAPSKAGVSIGDIEDHNNGFTSVHLRVTMESGKFRTSILEAVQDELNED